MMFHLSPAELPVEYPVSVGNVYRPKGGRGKGAGWLMVVVSVIDGAAIYLSIDQGGRIMTAGRCSVREFAFRRPVGCFPDLKNLSFDVEMWEGPL